MGPSSPDQIEETLEFLHGTIAKRKQNEELVFAICKCDTHQFLGACGLHKIGTPHPVLGIWIKQSAHDNRYGRKAISALADWANQHLDYEYLTYPVDRNNIPSCKIPKSLGGEIFEEYSGKKMDGDTLDLVVYKIHPKRWNITG